MAPPARSPRSSTSCAASGSVMCWSMAADRAVASAAARASGASRATSCPPSPMSRRGRAPPSERAFREEQMRIHNLYTDANGESHFRDIEVEWAEERRGSKLSRKLPATGVIFRETQAEHNANGIRGRGRQYTVNLEAGGKTPASDGEGGFTAAGDVILVENTTGRAICPITSRTRSATRSSFRSSSAIAPYINS